MNSNCSKKIQKRRQFIAYLNKENKKKRKEKKRKERRKSKMNSAAAKKLIEDVKLLIDFSSTLPPTENVEENLEKFVNEIGPNVKNKIKESKLPNFPKYSDICSKLTIKSLHFNKFFKKYFRCL
jgi:hypothetical protein